MSITRRLFLRNGAAASAAAAAVTIPTVAATAQPSPRERLMVAIEEVKAAASLIWPDITDWKELVATDSQAPYADCPVFLVAFKPALPRYLEWSGPAIYEVEQGTKRPVYYVDRVWSAMDGAWLYRGCHWWKGKQDGPFIYFGPHEPLKIVRKVREAAI